MPESNLVKHGFWSAGIFLVALLGWELYLRADGVNNAFDDDAALFANSRKQIYLPKDKSTVFIGSSRIKFDLDMETWESTTGDYPVQLACVGSTPLPQLYDLAKDEKFKGKLVIDVTEILFFSQNPGNLFRPNEGLKYYHDLTPAQRASFEINKPLQHSLVFLDKENYSINALFDKLEVKSREGVFMGPIFPRDFERTKLNRQSGMMPAFVADTNQQNEQKAIWAFFAKQRSKPPIDGAPLDSMLNEVKKAVDQIKARGGEVVFVRTPSSGVFWFGEQKGYPRDKYWERILATTGCKGIHFMDYPETDHYVCPELSHLSPDDAIHYTKHLARTLQHEIGWKFPKTL